jgi:thymidine phosphorylase
MLLLSGKADSLEAALSLLNEHLESGAALEKFKEMVRLQGGNPEVIDRPALLPQASIIEPVLAPADGFVQSVDAEHVGRGVLLLGAGRQKTDDAVDFAVGVSHLVKTGEAVKKDGVLMQVHANSREQLKAALEELEQAVCLSDNPTTPPPLNLETI